MSDAQRRAATEQHEQAIAAINGLFDKADELSAARDRLTGIEPLDPNDDSVRDAELLLGHAAALSEALEQLRAAAVVAAGHRRRRDLAADIGTKVTSLFPRGGRDLDLPAPTRDGRRAATYADSGPLGVGEAPAAG